MGYFILKEEDLPTFIFCDKEDCENYIDSTHLLSDTVNIRITNLSDEMKLEAFLENMGSKTLEQIQEFFKK